MKTNYLLFLSVRNLTERVRLDYAGERSIFQDGANKCFYGQNNPFLPTHPPKKKENYFVRKFMVCLFIERLNLAHGQRSLFLSELFFST